LPNCARHGSADQVHLWQPAGTFRLEWRRK
jgi:hypothetical protein